MFKQADILFITVVFFGHSPHLKSRQVQCKKMIITKFLGF